jgi:hypothetical protein
LLGALAATLVILKLSQLVIRALIDIGNLGNIIDRAAQGIASNVSVIPTLPDLGPAGEQLTSAGQKIGRALESVSRRLAVS